MDNTRLTSRILAPSQLDAPTVAAWERLQAATPELASPFFSVHFARAVEKTGMRVRVCVLMSNGEPVGFLPYQLPDFAARLTGAAEPVGGVMSDYVGLIAAPNLRIAPTRLMQLAGIRSFGFSHLDEPQLAYGLEGSAPRIGLRLRLQGPDPLAAHLRDQNRYLRDSERLERQLIRDVGPLEYCFDAREGRTSLLDDLIRHKRAQYQRTGAADAMAAPWTTRLLHLLAETRHPSCSGQLSTLYAGGTWLATHFGLTGNGVLHHWMPVYNPDFSRYAPGRLLMHRMIQSCPEAGLGMIDHGEGDSPSKRYLSNEEHQYFRGAWHTSFPLNLPARTYHSLKWRLNN